MSENIVLIEENEDKSITTIKMNHMAKRNALGFDMLTGIQNAIDKIARSKTRVVIITGIENVFSSGIDLNFLTGQNK